MCWRPAGAKAIASGVEQTARRAAQQRAAGTFEADAGLREPINVERPAFEPVQAVNPLTVQAVIISQYEHDVGALFRSLDGKGKGE